MVKVWGKNLNTSDISYTRPEKKVDKVYVSYASINEAPCVVQFDRVPTSVSDGGKLVFDFDSIQMKQTIEFLAKQKCVDSSAEWFKGRIFTIEYIESAFNTLLDTGKARYYDSARKHVYPSEIVGRTDPFSTQVIVEFVGLQFSGRVITALWELKQGKFDFTHIDDYIGEVDDDDDSEVTEEADPIPEPEPPVDDAYDAPFDELLE